MLDDHTGRFFERLYTFQRRIGVSHVVEGQFLALQNLGRADTGLCGFGFTEERRALVGIFAVTHFLHFLELHVEGAGKGGFAAVFLDGAQVVGDHAVVLGRVLKRSQGQFKAGAVRHHVAVGLHFGQYATVIGGVYHNGDPLVVLRRGANHGRAADIDVLDSGFQIAIRLCHGLFKRVQVDGDQVDGGNAVGVHHCAVHIAPAQNATMYLRMQGLDAAVHHFRKTGVVGHFDGVDALILQQLVGTAGGQDFHTQVGQGTGKVHDAGFVGNTD